MTKRQQSFRNRPGVLGERRELAAESVYQRNVEMLSEVKSVLNNIQKSQTPQLVNYATANARDSAIRTETD